jgi:hypothetical protein
MPAVLLETKRMDVLTHCALSVWKKINFQYLTSGSFRCKFREITCGYLFVASLSIICLISSFDVNSPAGKSKTTNWVFMVIFGYNNGDYWNNQSPTIAVFDHVDIKITIDDISLLLEAITEGMQASWQNVVENTSSRKNVHCSCLKNKMIYVRCSVTQQLQILENDGELNLFIE